MAFQTPHCLIMSLFGSAHKKKSMLFFGKILSNFLFSISLILIKLSTGSHSIACTLQLPFPSSRSFGAELILTPTPVIKHLPCIFGTGWFPRNWLSEGDLKVSELLWETSDGCEAASILNVSLQWALGVCCCVKHQGDDWRLRGRALVGKDKTKMIKTWIKKHSS